MSPNRTQLLLYALSLPIILLSPLVWAQPSTDDSFVIEDDSSVSTEGRPGGELRRYCGRSDYSDCSNECRKFFDDAYHRCRKDCLERQCVEREIEKKDKEKEKAEASDQSKFCIELESTKCVEDCDNRGERTLQLRCRRACLIDRCPDSLHSDSSKEAMNPGSVACDRCKESVKDTCKQACLGGMAAGGSSYNGLVGFGCNIACAKTRCADKCPAVEFPN